MRELFLKVVNMSISASWLVLAVLVLRFALKRAPKWVNVLLWGIVAVRLICPFSLESAVSLIPSAETIPTQIMEQKSEAELYDTAMITIVDNPVLSEVVEVSTGTSEQMLRINFALWSIIWGFGIACFGAYTFISYWRLSKRIRTAVLFRDNIFQSEAVSSPFVLGIIRPKIYLPFQMDGKNLEHVVSHEQAHIRRRDHWWKPLGFLLLTLHWFNPLMWLAYVLLCRDIELACDEKVIKELGKDQRADYSQALLACSVNRRMIAACPLAFGEGGVKERVKTVLNYKKPAFWVIAVSLITCVVVAICFLTNPIGFRFDEANDTIVSATCFDMRRGEDSATDELNLAQISELGSRLSGVKNTKKSDEYAGFTPGYQISALLQNGSYIRISGYSLSDNDMVDIEWNGERYVVSDSEFQEYLSRICASGDVAAAEKAVAGKTYLYEKEGIMGDFTITLYNDGTFSYYEGMASSYLGFGLWKQEGDIVTMTDDGTGGYGLINRFKLDGDNLIFVEDGSSNFIYVKVQDGEQFHCTGEAFKPMDAITQPVDSQTLSLNDVIMLSQKGYNLTWSDFDQYKYIETGSGLYIRIYEIDEQFGLMIGGAPDRTPMYIYLCVSGSDDTRIDIRDGGVEEFITKDYSEVRLNSAIYDAILNYNLSEKTVGLNNCASFIMLDKEEISGTPVVGSTDHVGVVTVYGLALYQGYDLVNDELREEAGSHTPVAITFDVLNGKYSLKEYWRPGDGTYYEPDIREKFPDKIEDEAMNTQKYIAAQKQECYVQAMRNNGEEVSDPNQQPLSAEELSWFNETFYPIVYDKQGNPISVNPVSGFFSSYYDDVRNMDFEEFMRYFPGDGSFASDAEFEALKTVEAWPFDWVETRDDMPVPIHKYQARIVDMVLKEHAGITTADLDTSDVAYLADYDAFYNYTSDFGPGMFTCTRGEVIGDTIRLYEELETGTDMLILRKVGDNYQIVAHQCIEGDNNAERVYGR